MHKQFKSRWHELSWIVDSKFEEVAQKGFLHVRGDSNARRLLIAPPLTVGDMTKGQPFSAGEAPRLFETLIKQELDLNTNDDFVVVCCTDIPSKPLKATTKCFMLFLSECIKRELFDLYVCLGADAFKTAFGQGKKPSMRSLSGNRMTMPEAGHKDVFVFPDVEPMIVRDAGDFKHVRETENAQQFFHSALEKAKLAEL